MRVALLSSHPVGTKMAGPGIRYYKLMEHLSSHFEVALFSPSYNYDGVSIPIRPLGDWKKESSKYDVLITQGYRIPVSFISRFRGKRIIDMYTPLIIEYLEHTGGKRRWKHRAIVLKTLYLLKKADAILVANERQINFYAGLMTGWGLIGGKDYLLDRTLMRKFILLPSGIDEKIPEKRDLLKSRGIREEGDFIFVWNGGLWRWFDPIIAVRAIKLLRDEGLNVKLLFLGRKTPSREEEGIDLVDEVHGFASEYGLIGKGVFFYDEWVEYEVAKSIIAECDAGLCTFRDTLEARISFRTRFLDYLECGIPVVWTDGDYFSDLLKKAGGITVPGGDVNALVEGMRRVIERRDEERMRILELRKHFLWKKVIEPLIDFIRE